MWLDKSLTPPALKIYDGSAWVVAGSGGGGGSGAVTLLRWSEVASGGETALSGPDSSSQVLSYTPGLEEVFVNGSFLTRGVDYVAVNGTSITNLAPLPVGAEVTVLAWSPFDVASVPGSSIQNGTITGQKLAPSSVTADKIATGAVVDATVAANAAVQSTKLAFTPGGTGAVTRTVSAKLRDTVSVKDFGAAGDGSDATAAIQAAINAVHAAGGGAVMVPAGVYAVSSSITLMPGVSLVGAGSHCTVLDQGAFSGQLLRTPVVAEVPLTQTSNLSEGDASNLIANSCSPGDFIRYQSNQLFTDRWNNRVIRNYYYEAEMLEVLSATGTSVTFAAPPIINCSVANSRSVVTFTPSRGFQVEGLTLRKSSAVTNYSVGLLIERAADVSIDDVATEYYDNAGISVTKSMHVSVGSTRHVGGSVSLGLCYGTIYSDGTKYCYHASVMGTACRHALAGGGTGWGIPMYVTVNSAEVSDSKLHSVDAHAGTAYFTINSVQADTGVSLSGLGHKLLSANCTDGGNSCFPYEGGINIYYGNYTVTNGTRMYTNEALVDCVFENVTFRSPNISIISFRSGASRNLRFRGLSVICTRAATATSAAGAEAGLTADSRGISGILPQGSEVDGLYVEGLPWGISIDRPDVSVHNVTVQDCGWSGGALTTEAAVIRMTGACNRCAVQNVNIYNKNTNLTWNSTNFRIAPTPSASQVTVENVFNSRTTGSCVSLTNSLVTSAVSQLFLKNIRTTNRGGGNSFAAASGKYIYQTLTADN